MPHYLFETKPDGTIRRILRDGRPSEKAVSLEQVYSVVTFYFRLARQHLETMSADDTNYARRTHGVQSFLMSLTGLEAFINTYYKMRAEDIGDADMLARIAQTHGSLTKKLVELAAMTPGEPLQDQDALMDKIFALCQLRHDIMHPRWESSGLTIGGAVPIHILGLVENPHALFEDETLCREAMFWCLLAVARVAQAQGFKTLEGFLFHWTGNYGLKLSKILEVLGLPPEAE